MIQTIIHLAAYLNVSEAEKNKKKYFKNNVQGTKIILESCKNSNVKNLYFHPHVLYTVKLTEQLTKKKLKPNGYYAFTKLKGEELVTKYSKKYRFS